MTEAERIAIALRGRRAGRSWLAFCPAHPNTNTPALAITDGRDGRVLMRCHAGCSQSDVWAAVKALGVLDGSGPPVKLSPAERDRRDAKDDKERLARIAKAVQVWGELTPGKGTPVARYLREARGLPLRAIPKALRFHPRAQHPSGGGLTLPAMVARVDGRDGAPIGAHRTYLRPDGSGKADVTPARAALGPISGGAVRLAPASEVLAVGEGVESSLAFGCATRLPVWACLSTSGLRGVELPPLPLAAELVIAADHDAAGLAAAAALAKRATAEGRTVRIAKPPLAGADFADLLIDESGDRS